MRFLIMALGLSSMLVACENSIGYGLTVGELAEVVELCPVSTRGTAIAVGVEELYNKNTAGKKKRNVVVLCTPELRVEKVISNFKLD